MHFTLAQACKLATYRLANLIDERVLIRRECGDDFVTQSPAGLPLALDADDVAAVCGYADLRRAGYPVKLAGTIMGQLRTAMRANPNAAQLVAVRLENGFFFTLAVDSIDLSEGYNSGGFVSYAFLFDVRNYRARVQRAIAVNELLAERAEYVAA